ncbi:hypothetical protein CRYUN_Cryun18bG0008500 [Craigia yunnanensis]
MCLLDWFYGILASLGLYQKEAKILFLGLDNSGKTTLLHMLKNESFGGEIWKLKNAEACSASANTVPNIRGTEHWEDQIQGFERFAESKKELDALLFDESLADVTFLILGNKIDLPYASSEDELRYHMGLTNFTTGKGKVNLDGTNVRPLEVFMCSIVRKMGYGDGFRWLALYIK